MVAQIRSAKENEEQVALTRNKLVLEQARAVGLLGTAKNTRLSGRVPSELIDAAKKRAHVTSDTELLGLALSRFGTGGRLWCPSCRPERQHSGGYRS